MYNLKSWAHRTFIQIAQSLIALERTLISGVKEQFNKISKERLFCHKPIYGTFRIDLAMNKLENPKNEHLRDSNS